MCHTDDCVLQIKYDAQSSRMSHVQRHVMKTILFHQHIAAQQCNKHVTTVLWQFHLPYKETDIYTRWLKYYICNKLYTHFSLKCKLTHVQRHEYKVISSTLLLHVTCMILSQSSVLDPLITRIGHSSSTINWFQYQDHRPLRPVCRPSLVEQASSYSLCSLSLRSFIITQLFSIVMLWSWTACWPFSWHFPFSS